MKTLQLLLLSCVALATSSIAQSPGQVELRKYQTGGGMISSWVTPENSKALGFDGSGNAAMLPVGGSSTFAGLSDVGLTGLANLDLPQYNASTGKWNNIPRSTFALASDLAGYQPSATILGTLSGLSNSAGVLTNNGSGTLSYTDVSAAGAGVADANKLLKLDAFGGAVLGGAVTIKGDGTSSGTFYVYDASNADFTTIRRNPASAGSGLLLTPEVTGGTLIGSNDVGTVTRTMLADSPTITNLYTANDNWTNPSPATPRRVFVRLVGGGGGGGSGRKGAAGSNRGGGGAGGPGSVVEFWALTTDLSATESVTVGTGGTGGALISANSTNGAAGQDGGPSSFGSTNARGGSFGSGGTTAGGSGASTIANANSIGVSTVPTGTGGAGGTSNGSSGTTVAPLLASGGGGGGGLNTSNVEGLGANGGGTGVATTTTIIAGGVGGASGANGADGIAARGAGTGGGGGGASASSNAGNGGNGGGSGGGGGGGGASTDDLGNSGAGGNGAPGYALIITY